MKHESNTQLSPEEQEIKNRVLTQGIPSVAGSIAEAVVVLALAADVAD